MPRSLLPKSLLPKSLLPRSLHRLASVILIGILLIAASVIVMRSFSVHPSPGRVYRVGFGDDVPFQFKAADGTPTGVAVEMVREAARRRGIQLKWVEPLQGGAASIIGGEADLWVLLTDLPERHSRIYITEPYMTTERCFLVLKDGRDHSLPELVHGRLAYRGNWGRGDRASTSLAAAPNADEVYLRNFFPSAALTPLEDGSLAGLIAALKAGKADGALLNKNIVAALLMTGGDRDELDIVSAPDAVSALALGSSFAAKEAAEGIREEIRNMSADGTISAITSRWGFFPSTSLDIIESLATQRRWTRRLAMGAVTLLIAVAFIGFLAYRLHRESKAARVAEAQRARLLAEREEASRLESLGRLAGGVAHDFNNILTVIHSYGTSLLTGLDNRPELRHQAMQIVKAGASASTLTEQLLAFSRKRVVTPVAVDLNAVIRETTSILGKVVGPGVALELELAPRLPSILSTTGLMQQVLVNLAANARDAMQGRGSLFIRTSHTPGWVVLTVRDTGAGIPPELVAHIFEPFFTTKDVGKGTGLGLATVHGIVKQQQGRIGVESDAGRGATFSIHLPAVSIAPEAEPTAAPEPEPVHFRATVLLVEDNAEVRRLAGEVLRDRGYEVVEAADGVEALEIAEGRVDNRRENNDPFDLLITDLRMPRLGGAELARRVQASWPGTGVLFVTGFAQDAMAARVPGAPGYLLKPFLPGQLLEAVARALRDKPAAVRAAD